MTLGWIAALLIFPLMASDTRSATWAFCLGATLALDLYFFVRILLLTANA